MKSVFFFSLYCVVIISQADANPLGETIETNLSPTESIRILQESNMFEPHNEGYLYQGDMKFTEQQAMEILQRKFLTNLSQKWPRDSNNVLNINYIFGDEKVDKDNVAKSIAEWELKTCMKFTLLPSAPADKSSHLKFIDDDGCWSYVGNTQTGDDGGQEVSIGGSCDLSAGIHEIGHAIGFHHEQSRSDRDEYIKIFPENSKPAGRGQFTKEETNNFDIPYDYYSTMHYGAMFYSNGKITIRTLDPMFQSVIGGDTKMMSYMDAKLFNKAYQCIDDWEKSCPNLKDKCQNDGYVKKDRVTGVCACNCPEGTEGTHCDKFELDYYEAILEKYYPNSKYIYDEGTVSTPKYPEISDEFTFFTKYIEAPYDKKVSLQFLDLDMHNMSADNICEYEHLELRVDEYDDESGEIFCGGKTWKNRTFVSKDNVLILNYYNRYGNSKGFKAQFTFV